MPLRSLNMPMAFTTSIAAPIGTIRLCQRSYQRNPHLGVQRLSRGSTFLEPARGSRLKTISEAKINRLLGCRASAARKGFFEDIEDPVQRDNVDDKESGSAATSSHGPDGNGASSREDLLNVSDKAAERSRAAPLTAWELLQDTVGYLYKNFWPLMLIFALTDLLMFALHRVSHRITNEAAIALLGSINRGSLGNMWFLSNNPAVANFDTGYQYLVVAFFLVVFPMNVLIRSFASTITTLYAWKNAGEPNACPDLKPTFIPPVRRIWKNVRCIWPRMQESVMRVWMVDLLVAVRVLPLQCLSLLVVTLPWTLPRLLSLQLANPASVIEGWEGDEAIKRSGEMMKVQGVTKALLWPYVALIVALRLVSMGRTPILSALPARIIREVPEIPFVVYISLMLASLVLSRLQDLLPLAVFKAAKDREEQLS